MLRWLTMTMLFLGFMASASGTFLAQSAKGKEKPKEELPASDDEAKELLKAAWGKVISPPGFEKDAISRFYADSQSKVNFDDVPDGYKVRSWTKKAVASIMVEAKTAWVSHEEAFSQHVLDGKKSSSGKRSWGGMGVKRAISGGQIKNGHALTYLLGMRDFDSEFKDHTFTFGASPHKDWKIVIAWYNYKHFKFSKSYFIDKKGKGFIRHFTKRERLFILQLSKEKRKQSYIEGLTIQPVKALEKISYEKKKKKKKAKKGEEVKEPIDPRYDESLDWYRFGKREVVVGKKTEMALSVTTWVTYEKKRIPVTTFLINAKFNEDATEELVKSAGFGKRLGDKGLPPPTYSKKKQAANNRSTGGSDADKKEGDKREESKEPTK